MSKLSPRLDSMFLPTSFYCFIPYPIIFMANILPPLRYSLLFLFALYGLVTASAIIRVVLMTAGKFLQSENNFYMYLISFVNQLTIDYHGGQQLKVQSLCLS